MRIPHILVGSRLNIYLENITMYLHTKIEEYVPNTSVIYGFENHGEVIK